MSYFYSVILILNATIVTFLIVERPVVVVAVVVVVVSSILVVKNERKYRCKGHRDNQDGVGDGEYKYKDKTDDAELFGLLQFVALLLTEGLWEWKGEVCECVCTCVWVRYSR